jgi:hypothetical protein
MYLTGGRKEEGEKEEIKNDIFGGTRQCIIL